MSVTDQDDGKLDQLTAEQEAHVRRLLADARHTEAMPDVVVARLDKVLAGLADEPAREATVVRLADRRRRAATMLVAAAAVVVGGIGIAQVIPSSDGGLDASTAGEAEDADVPHAFQGEAEDQSGSESAPGESDGPQAGTPGDRASFRVSSERFARDAAALQAIAPTSTLADDELAERQAVLDGADLLRAQRAVCEPGAWGRGRFVPVVYDKAPGWLALRRPQGESQIADLFLCGSEVVVRSVTLPYP